MLTGRLLVRSFIRSPRFFSTNNENDRPKKNKNSSTRLVKPRNASGDERVPVPVVQFDRETAERRARRARLLDIWQHRNDYCEANFDHSLAIIMLDREPLVRDTSLSSSSFSSTSTSSEFGGSTSLVMGNCKVFRQCLHDYGLLMDTQNSCLLDFVDGVEPNRPDLPLFGCALLAMRPPEESGISLADLKTRLASELGGRFISQRRATYTLRDNYERELLAKFQGMTYWYHVHRFCPSCATALDMRSSKAFAKCLPCNRRYYPTITSVVMCLICSPTDSHCVLLRACGRPKSVFTTVIGVSESGESAQTTVRREIARSVGLDCSNLRPVNLSQTWPPEARSTLTSAFVATASMDQKLDPFSDDIALVGWFSREEVTKALKNTRENAAYLERVEMEYDAASAAAIGDRVYYTKKRRAHPPDYEQMRERMEMFDRYETLPKDYTTTVEEPVGVESVRESYRRHRHEDQGQHRYDLDQLDGDEDEEEGKKSEDLPDYHVDKIYKREMDRIKMEQEMLTGKRIVDLEAQREEEERRERARRRATKRQLRSDVVFQVPSRSDEPAEGEAGIVEPERMEFVPPEGSIAHTLLQAWVDRRL